MRIGKMITNKELYKKVRDLREYLNNNPSEIKRFDQCFNCKKLMACTGNCEEDNNGMCLGYIGLEKGH